MDRGIPPASPLTFALRWTRGRPLALLALDVRPPRGEWAPALPAPLHDDDGEIAVDLAGLPPGRAAIRFLAGAWADVPKAAAFIVGPGQRAEKVAPRDPDAFERLAAGELWRVTATVEIGGGDAAGDRGGTA